MPEFYLLKTIVVIFPMTLVSLFAFISSDIDGESVANQLALATALAAYTLTTTDWQPVRKSLSYIDWYILVSLLIIIVTCVWMTFRMWWYKSHATGNDAPQPTRAETIVWLSMIALWTLVHVVFFLPVVSSPKRGGCPSMGINGWATSLYPCWRLVFEEERRQLEAHRKLADGQVDSANEDRTKAMNMLKHRDETSTLLPRAPSALEATRSCFVQ